MAHSTATRSRRKSTRKRKKPTPDFPLFHHHSGRWCKKVRPVGDPDTGIRPKPKFHYFGRVEDDKTGAKALALWNEQKDDLLAGHTPRSADGSPTVGFLCNEFIAAKKLKVATGEMMERTYADYYATCELLGKKLGFKTPLDQLKPGDFTTLRSNMAKGTRKKWSAVRLGNAIQRVRTIFKWGDENDILDKPMKFGPDFKKPAKKEIRKARKAKGPRMIEAADVRRLLWKSGTPMKAMILLAVNCGLGNSDVGNLPLSAIDLAGGWLNYPRPKTGIDRRCKLWPETIKRLRRAIAERPAPKDPAHADLAFITKYGGPWAKAVADSPVTKEFRKLLDEIKLHRPGLGFYSLRHVFETIAGETRDQVAVDHVMGHARDDMASVYRERISDARLVAVAEHVRAWLCRREGGER
jgi:integrase